MCIDAAVRAAQDFGYTVTAVHDACASRELEFHGVSVPAEQIHAAFMAALDFGYATVLSTEEYLGTATADRRPATARFAATTCTACPSRAARSAGRGLGAEDVDRMTRMAECYSARISFNVVYRAKEGELVTRERAEGLAQTMLAVLRGSPKIKVVELYCADVEEVEET